eukprot:5997539-Amphidinium_carterae.1
MDDILAVRGALDTIIGVVEGGLKTTLGANATMAERDCDVSLSVKVGNQSAVVNFDAGTCSLDQMRSPIGLK